MELVVYADKDADKSAALALSRRVNAPLSSEPGDGLSLMIDSTGISLIGYGLTYQGDFEQLIPRVTKGRLTHEMLIRAAKPKEPGLSAIDAAAGMGEDAFLLAAAGYEVTLYEKNAVIAALLQDAMRRARKNELLKDIIGRMTLVEGDSIELIPKREARAELVYLDPMFPARKKSGLINKKLQLIQKLEQPCGDEKALLDAAISASPKKIIIKRPLKGASLAGIKPSYAIKGKAIRYDCIAFPEAAGKRSPNL